MEGFIKIQDVIRKLSNTNILDLSFYELGKGLEQKKYIKYVKDNKDESVNNEHTDIDNIENDLELENLGKLEKLTNLNTPISNNHNKDSNTKYITNNSSLSQIRSEIEVFNQQCKDLENFKIEIKKEIDLTHIEFNNRFNHLMVMNSKQKKSLNTNIDIDELEENISNNVRAGEYHNPAVITKKKESADAFLLHSEKVNQKFKELNDKIERLTKHREVLITQDEFNQNNKKIIEEMSIIRKRNRTVKIEKNAKMGIEGLDNKTNKDNDEYIKDKEFNGSKEYKGSKGSKEYDENKEHLLEFSGSDYDENVNHDNKHKLSKLSKFSKSPNKKNLLPNEQLEFIYLIKDFLNKDKNILKMSSSIQKNSDEIIKLKVLLNNLKEEVLGPADDDNDENVIEDNTEIKGSPNNKNSHNSHNSHNDNKVLIKNEAAQKDIKSSTKNIIESNTNNPNNTNTGITPNNTTNPSLNVFVEKGNVYSNMRVLNNKVILYIIISII